MSQCTTCGQCLVNEAKITALVDHFQKTFELNHSLWQERNKNFLFLLCVVGVELLIIFRTEGVISVMADVYSKFLREKSTVDIASGFPFDLLVTILLVVILYLMIQIYHRTSHINRTFGYIKIVEDDIRTVLDISGDGEKSFTRESEYYQKHWRYLLKLTGIVYALILGALLLPIIYGIGKPLEPATEVSAEVILASVNVLVLLMIVVYYVSYFYLTLEPYVTGDKAVISLSLVPATLSSGVRKAGDQFRLWRQGLSSGRFRSALRTAIFFYGVPYGIAVTLLSYAFDYWMGHADLISLKAAVELVLFIILFGLFSCLWIYRHRRMWTSNEGVGGG